MIRWKIIFGLWLKYPVFGVGFGRMLLPYTLPSIRGTERLGSFNMGMPHNTFLFLAARMGFVGLLSVLFCWLSILGRLFVVSRHSRRVEELATANILAVMVGVALFSLFFERPELNAAFWIVMAIAQRLMECPGVASASSSLNARYALNLRRA
jgi:O-antigen ligase